MAQVTADLPTVASEQWQGSRRPLAAKAGAVIPSGTLAFYDGGYGTETPSGAGSFAGIAVDRIDNAGGANGAVSGDVYTRGRFDLPSSGLTQVDIGKTAYSDGNGGASKTQSGDNPAIGVIAVVESAVVAGVDINVSNELSRIDALEDV